MLTPENIRDLASRSGLDETEVMRIADFYKFPGEYTGDDAEHMAVHQAWIQLRRNKKFVRRSKGSKGSKGGGKFKRRRKGVVEILC